MLAGVLADHLYQGAGWGWQALHDIPAYVHIAISHLQRGFTLREDNYRMISMQTTTQPFLTKSSSPPAARPRRSLRGAKGLRLRIEGRGLNTSRKESRRSMSWCPSDRQHRPDKDARWARGKVAPL